MKTILLLLLFSVTISAQIKGVVKDSLTGKPISYVNVSVENENIRTTSEENGQFTINTTEKSQNLIFSALGFEKKTVKISNSKEVFLKEITYDLDEVIISRRKESKQIEIGKIKKGEIYQAFENGPTIDIKFFEYNLKYLKTPYIKKVTFFADSRKENSTIKIHFYKVDSNGFPGEEMLKKDLIIPLKKGVVKNIFNVSDYNLRIPKNGIFVGFEKLLIENNTVEKTLNNAVTNTSKVYKTYLPYALYGRAEKEFIFTYNIGKWTKKENLKGNKMEIDEPAINLILTN